MTVGAVHRSPGIFLTAEENSICVDCYTFCIVKLIKFLQKIIRLINFHCAIVFNNLKSSVVSTATVHEIILILSFLHYVYFYSIQHNSPSQNGFYFTCRFNSIFSRYSFFSISLKFP